MKKAASQTRSREPQAAALLEEPARPTLWASLVFAIATLTLSYPGLTGQILFNTRSDQYTNGYGFRIFAEEWFRQGKGIPQWNPYLMGGVPYVGAMHGDIFYPTFLLRLLLGTAEGITWEFPIHLFIAGLCTYLFLRAWRLPFYAAVVGGIAYMLSGSIAGLAMPGHDGKLFVAALFPLVLHLLTRGIRDGRGWAWGAFAITIGLALLSPHPQLFQYMLLASGAFALYLAFATHDEVGRLPNALAIRRLAFAAGGVALGLLIGAIQFAPLLAYKPYSPRSGGHDWETATSFSFPIEETLNAYLPQFSGILDKYWGQNGIHFHSDYFGAAVLFLMGAAFGAGLHKSFKRFWVGCGIVALLWAYGGHTPLYHIFLLVPGTKYFRAPSTIIYITAFAVAVLAAIGTERLLRKQVGRRYAPGWAIASAVFAVLLSIGGYRLLVGLAANFASMGMDASIRDQAARYYAERAEGNVSSAILGAWRSFVFVALVAGVAWAYLMNRLSLRTAGLALAAITIVDLWSIERYYWEYMPPASQTFASDAAIDAIKADIAKSGEPGRTLVLPLGRGFDSLDPVVRKRSLMAHLLRTVEGEQGNELDRYRRMINADSGRLLLTPSFWRHENARYLYTDADTAMMAGAASQLGMPPFVKLAGPARNAGGSMIYAYRVGTPNPLAWVAGGAVQAQAEQVLPTVLDPRFDPALAAVVDTGATLPLRQPAQLVPATIKATTRSYEPGAISIELSAPATAGQVLMVSENYYPGWVATSGGATLPVGRANYNLIGVGLAQGTQRIDLHFAEPAYATGKVISLVAVLVAALLLVGGVVADRRHRPAAIVTPA